jgi:RNA polymerase I-specific transcription initiation factor RRN6
MRVDVCLLILNHRFEIIRNLRIPGDIHETSEEWHTEIEQLSHVDPAVEIMSLIEPNNKLLSSPSLQELFFGLGAVIIGGHQNDFYFDSEAIHLVMRQIAGELYLSRFGIAYLPANITERHPPASSDALSSTQFADDMLIDGQESHRSTVLSPSLPTSMFLDSQASSRASTPASTAPSVLAKSDNGDGTEDWSMALVRTLTGSGKILLTSSEVLSMWREGEDPANHIFTVDKDTEITPGMRKRAKQEARDARKRKRTETLLQLQREHNLIPLTQPAPETRFSTQATQPLNEFSQARPIPSSSAMVTMSQPVSGAFGGRSGFERPKKKAKRKGGF